MLICSSDGLATRPLSCNSELGSKQPELPETSKHQWSLLLVFIKLIKKFYLVTSGCQQDVTVVKALHSLLHFCTHTPM